MIAVPLAISTATTTATAIIKTASISSPRFCDSVLALVSGKVVMDAGDTGALDETGPEVAEERDDASPVAMGGVVAVTADMEAVEVSSAETERHHYCH